VRPQPINMNPQLDGGNPDPIHVTGFDP
jgi:hypothetical protein